MKIILLGAPGVGKGTQARYLCARHRVPQISTGDMLREAARAGGELGRRAESFMKRGALVPDNVIVGLVSERIAAADCRNGFLFDGFPRTLAQARALEWQRVSIDFVVEIVVSDEEIIRRLDGRRTHPASGRTYHVEYNPPRVVGLDDATGEALIQRDDDTPGVVARRLETYHEQTAPLVEHYRRASESGVVRYVAVDGAGGVEQVRREITERLG